MKKKELTTSLTESRERLLEAIDGLFDEQLQAPGVIDDWSVKDILYHLTMWEAELIKLLWQLSQGETPSNLLVSNRSVDELNAEWAEQSKIRSLDKVLDDLDSVRRQTIRRINMFKDEELDNPARFPVLEGEPLWKWIAAETFKHEAEHIPQIIAWRKIQDI